MPHLEGFFGCPFRFLEGIELLHVNDLGGPNPLDHVVATRAVPLAKHYVRYEVAKRKTRAGMALSLSGSNQMNAFLGSGGRFTHHPFTIANFSRDVGAGKQLKRKKADSEDLAVGDASSFIWSSDVRLPLSWVPSRCGNTMTRSKSSFPIAVRKNGARGTSPHCHQQTISEPMQT